MFCPTTFLTYFRTRNTILALFLTSGKVKTVKIRNYWFFTVNFTVKKHVFWLRLLVWSEKFSKDILFLVSHHPISLKMPGGFDFSDLAFLRIPRLKLFLQRRPGDRRIPNRKNEHRRYDEVSNVYCFNSELWLPIIFLFNGYWSTIEIHKWDQSKICHWINCTLPFFWVMTVRVCVRIRETETHY